MNLCFTMARVLLTCLQSQGPGQVSSSPDPAPRQPWDGTEQGSFAIYNMGYDKHFEDTSPERPNLTEIP